MTEHAEQEKIIAWKNSVRAYCPELDLLFAVPNEMTLGWRTSKSGRRYNAVATRFKQEGMQGGVPDLCLPVARCGYHAFYIEMKWGRNYLSEKQIMWCAALVEQGCRVDVHYTAEAAIAALCDYLNIGELKW